MTEFSRRELLATGAAVGVAGMADGAVPPPARLPNIVFILADDLGYADLGCYGRREYKTPAIDGLAAQGVRLIQGYANSAVCSATRTALITGRYQYRLPIGLEEPLGKSELALPPGIPTLPSQFRKLGYRTALLGKWHLGTGAQDGPTFHGYDHFFGFPNGGADYFRHRLDLTGKSPTDGLYDDTKKIERNGYLTDLLGDEAVRWMAIDKRPFMLSLHFNAPHWPWEGRDDEAVSRALKDVQHHDGGSLETFGKMVGAMDDNVAKVLAALKRLGLEQDTIIVFTSDNGGERYSDVWPFTGLKGELLEGGLRVPLIVRWPGRIAAGSTSPQVMTTMDFLPTLLAAAGGAPDPTAPSDGENLLPILTGQAPVRPRKLYWRYKNHEQRALRDGDWKYLLINKHEHLFNVALDPRERAERKDAEPALFARLKADYEKWNATMLPYPASSGSHGVDSADRYWVD
jgi:arylsulfatase A-like enzyme